MASGSTNIESGSPPGLGAELAVVWRRVPNAALFLGLLAAWVLLFQFFGNSTLGYVDTRSLFGWWKWVHSQSPDDAHTILMPAVVAFLLWHRRRDFAGLATRIWWPGMAIFLAGLIGHLLGYAVQQTRLSVLGFFCGLFGMGAVMWGPGWMRRAVVPFGLFVFCVPLGTAADALTFPLRMVATQITAVICRVVLGVDVIQRGNQLFDAGGHYQYEVAAACSGIQSLTAVLALALIYSYLNFRSLVPTALMLLAGIPLAVVANVARLVMIIVAAEAFGQSAGDYVHASGTLSLLPYIPALGGMFLIGRLFKRFFAEPSPAGSLLVSDGDEGSGARSKGAGLSGVAKREGEKEVSP